VVVQVGSDSYIFANEAGTAGNATDVIKLVGVDLDHVSVSDFS
jgi:hypothetical protein